MSTAPTLFDHYSPTKPAPRPALVPIPTFVPPSSPEDALAPREFRTVAMVPGLGAQTRKRLLAYANQTMVRTGKKPPSLLLFGPPGTGKTMFGAVIARHTGRRFIYARISEWDSAGPLNNHLSAMRDAFQQAADAAPSLFFLDEVDRFAHRQSATHYHLKPTSAAKPTSPSSAPPTCQKESTKL